MSLNPTASRSPSPSDLMVVGRITTVHGVKGWVKIHPYTDERENIFDYKPWWLQTDQGWKKIQVAQYKVASQDLIVQILDFDDRDIARQELCQRNIAVERSEFPELDSSEYYWHQLEGLRVFSTQGGVDLGVVTGLMETGANDVLEVKGDINSLDFKERLIPYTKQVVLTVNLVSKKIEVDWGTEF